jgi:hypothetical protein
MGTIELCAAWRPELQDSQQRIVERGLSAYRTAITSGSEVIDLTALNNITKGSAGDSFMMFVEDVAKKYISQFLNINTQQCNLIYGDLDAMPGLSRVSFENVVKCVMF